VTQIEYYTERVKRMVGKVLNGNGITRCERGSYALVGGDAQRLGQRPGSAMHQMPLRVVPGES
jgi:hypothetical protein